MEHFLDWFIRLDEIWWLVLGVAAVYVLVFFFRLIDRDKEEPMSDEKKEFLENAEWKDVTMPDGQVVSMPYEKGWEKKTLAYKLLYGKDSEEE